MKYSAKPHEPHKHPVHHESVKHGSDKVSVSDHSHPMHRGPHHDKYIHAENRSSGGEQVVMGKHGSHELGDKNHIDSLIGEPKGADVAGHKGKMHW